MTYLVAIDPGEVRWGIAQFTDDTNSATPRAAWGTAWRCVQVAVLDFWAAVDWLAEHLELFDVDHLVYERWAIRADKVREMTGSECGTAEAVGIIKHLVRDHNQEARPDPTDLPIASVAALHTVEPFEKEPAAALCRTAGIRSVAKQLRNQQGGSTHDTLAAELVGWAWLFKTKRVEANTGAAQ